MKNLLIFLLCILCLPCKGDHSANDYETKVNFLFSLLEHSPLLNESKPKSSNALRAHPLKVLDSITYECKKCNQSTVYKLVPSETITEEEINSYSDILYLDCYLFLIRDLNVEANKFGLTFSLDESMFCSCTGKIKGPQFFNLVLYSANKKIHQERLYDPFDIKKLTVFLKGEMYWDDEWWDPDGCPLNALKQEIPLLKRFLGFPQEEKRSYPEISPLEKSKRHEQSILIKLLELRKAKEEGKQLSHSKKEADPMYIWTIKGKLLPNDCNEKTLSFTANGKGLTIFEAMSKANTALSNGVESLFEEQQSGIQYEVVIEDQSLSEDDKKSFIFTSFVSH